MSNKTLLSAGRGILNKIFRAKTLPKIQIVLVCLYAKIDYKYFLLLYHPKKFEGRCFVLPIKEFLIPTNL